MRRPQLRLRTKISLYFVGLLLLWSDALLALHGYFDSQTSEHFFKESGAEIARALAARCVPLACYEDTTAIARALRREMDAHRYLRYLVLLDNAGAPIWSTFPTGVPRDLLAKQHPPPTGEDVSVQLLSAGGDLLYDYECHRAGVRLRMGASLAPLSDPVKRTFIHVLWIGALGLLGVFGLALWISQPVETLTRAIERAVLLDHETGAAPPPAGTLETTVIADRFHELLNRLEERTRQLDGSRKLAYLGEISAGIAHEVNNPLGVIVMNSDFLSGRARAGELPAPAVREVERLQVAARRATLAMQKLLQFARYSARDGNPHRREIRLEPLLRETVDLLEDRIRSSGCTVSLEIDPALPPLVCDDQGIQQILFNLLTNALDASPAGGPLAIRAFRNGTHVCLEVSDRGDGMTEEVLRRAREPFFTTKEPGRGSGLGLSISDSIVARHGGEMAIESRKGQGTRVLIRLPLERQA